MRTNKIYIKDKYGEQYVIPDDGIEDFDVYDEAGNKIYKFLDSEKEFRLKQNDSTAVE